MGFKKLSLERKIILLILALILINGLGFFLFIPSLSVASIYQDITSVSLLLILWISSFIIIKRIFNIYFIIPLSRLEKVSQLSSVGDLSQKVEFAGHDEIGHISASMDAMIQNQLNMAKFAERIGDGDYNAEYTLLSDKDILGSSITNMRDKLQKLAVEDNERNWSSQGLTSFSAILRDEADDMSALCDNVLSSLVKYMEANQGMIYLLQREKGGAGQLELRSVYAWNRKKYLSTTLEVGEGLIGQAALEKGVIYLTDVPDDYIRITSGLGDANPNCILIVPLIFEDELFGVLEIASFRKFKNHEIEFVEKLGEMFASTIARVETNEQTQQLLRDSQQLTEEMRAQEEEMRQNLEEMNATQEEMQQREVERIGIFTAINNTLATAEFNLDGKIITTNEKFIELMGYSLEEVENKTDRMFTDQNNEPIEVFNEFWSDLRKGIVKTGDFQRYTKSGREVWLNASYTPALDKDGKPYKVIQLAQDITGKKKVELETQMQAEELRKQGEQLKAYTSELEDIKKNLSEKLNKASQGLIKKIEDIETEKAKNIAVLEGCVDGVITFNQDGIIEYFNKAAEEIWGIERQKVVGKPLDLVMPVKLEHDENTIRALFSHNGSHKEIGVRTEMSWTDDHGKETDLLVTLTHARVGSDIAFTIFAQKISIDLF